MTSLTISPPPLSCPLLPTVFNFGTSDKWSLFSGLVKKKNPKLWGNVVGLSPGEWGR